MNDRQAPSLGVETPSGKDADYENFPVGSWILPARLRPHIARYYSFARAIDDIADNPELAADDKIERLSGFERAIGGAEVGDAFITGRRMHESLLETGVDARHCLDLIAAFKQDAVKNRYASWEELVDYCLLSAAPVGRYLIDLHGGSKDGYGPSDALCIALQVINHLQDCQEDYTFMDRVYIPEPWLAAQGLGVDVLSGVKTPKPLRKVLDQLLDATAALMPEAHRLPAGLASRRLAIESQAIINIADRLIRRLYADDPLAGPVRLSKAGYLWCCLRGLSGWCAPGRGR